MICSNCGYQSNEEFDFCPNCGKPAAENRQDNAQENIPQQPQADFQAEPVQPNFAYQRALSLFKDQLFFILCILQSVATGLSIIGKSFNVIGILFTIFLWLIYSQSKKDIANAKYMRYVSGTNFAIYVLGWVAAGAVVVLGILIAAIFTLIGSDSYFAEALTNELSKIIGGYSGLLVKLIYTASAFVFVVAIIAAVVIALFTFFGYRSIHKFSQSLYRSVECNDLVITKRQTAQSWMLVFGIFNCLSALGSVFSGDFLGLLSNGSSAGVFILAYLLVKKYYSDCNS